MASTIQNGRDFFRLLRESKLDLDGETQIEQTNVGQLSTTVAVESVVPPTPKIEPLACRGRKEEEEKREKFLPSFPFKIIIQVSEEKSSRRWRTFCSSD